MFFEGTGAQAFQALIGQVIEEVAVSKDGETTLRFKLRDAEKPHFVTTEGDCCSESWWADILGVRDSLGGEVLDIETLDLGDEHPSDNRSRQDSDIAYGYMIATTLGVITVVFRNSSNGYYGGWCFGGKGWSQDDPKWFPIETNSWAA